MIAEGSRLRTETAAFRPHKEREALALRERTIAAGGILFESKEVGGNKKNFVHIGNPFDARQPIVSIESFATEADVTAIKNEIIPIREAFNVLGILGTTYNQRQGVILEGPTAVGKTYLIKKFAELLDGKSALPVDFYCSGQTDVGELLAHFVPRTDNEGDKTKWQSFVASPQAREQFRQVGTRIAQADPEHRGEVIGTVMGELIESVGLSKSTQWRLELGAVPQAFQENKLLHVEEIGLAEPAVTNALLQLGGEHGRIANEVYIWQAGGMTIDRGSRTGLVASTNPPEDYIERNEIDPALARRFVWVRLPDISPESMQTVAEYYLTYRVGNKPELSDQDSRFLDISQYPEIGKQIAVMVGEFHLRMDRELRTQGEPGRRQKVFLTMDDIARLADYVLKFQVLSPETGRLDLPQTVMNGLELYYLGRLTDKGVGTSTKARLTTIAHQLMYTGALGRTFEGRSLSVSDILTTLVNREYRKEYPREFKQMESEFIRGMQEGAVGKLQAVLALAPDTDNIRGLLSSAINGEFSFDVDIHPFDTSASAVALRIAKSMGPNATLTDITRLDQDIRLLQSIVSPQERIPWTSETEREISLKIEGNSNNREELRYIKGDRAITVNDPHRPTVIKEYDLSEEKLLQKTSTGMEIEDVIVSEEAMIVLGIMGDHNNRRIHLKLFSRTDGTEIAQVNWKGRFCSERLTKLDDNRFAIMSHVANDTVAEIFSLKDGKVSYEDTRVLVPGKKISIKNAQIHPLGLMVETPEEIMLFRSDISMERDYKEEYRHVSTLQKEKHDTCHIDPLGNVIIINQVPLVDKNATEPHRVTVKTFNPSDPAQPIKEVQITIDGSLTKSAITPDGQLVTHTWSHDTLSIWDLESGEKNVEISPKKIENENVTYRANNFDFSNGTLITTGTKTTRGSSETTVPVLRFWKRG